MKMNIQDTTKSMRQSGMCVILNDNNESETKQTTIHNVNRN